MCIWLYFHMATFANSEAKERCHDVAFVFMGLGSHDKGLLVCLGHRIWGLLRTTEAISNPPPHVIPLTKQASCWSSTSISVSCCQHIAQLKEHVMSQQGPKHYFLHYMNESSMFNNLWYTKNKSGQFVNIIILHPILLLKKVENVRVWLISCSFCLNITLKRTQNHCAWKKETYQHVVASE